MKNSQAFLLTAALVLPGFGAWSVSAKDLFRAEVQTTAVVTNINGGLSYKNYGNRQILKSAAEAAGLTNLAGLRLVYTKTNDTLEVVKGTNDMVIATPLTFNGGVSLGKTNNTVLERLAWVYLGTNGMAAGTLRATEHSRFGTSNELTQFSLVGRLQFANPAQGTNGATIYSGTISAGNHGGHGDGDDDDQGEDHDH